jgi:hypothetical protein
MSKYFECGGCGSSFDLNNQHEVEVLQKHDNNELPCETFTWFCDNFGAVVDCGCSECNEE